MDTLCSAVEVLNRYRAYDTWVECMAHYASGETPTALEKSQNYIREVEKILEAENWQTMSTTYDTIAHELMFFFTAHCAVWAARVYRFGENKEKEVETNIGDFIMQDAETFYRKHSNIFQDDDHILHLKLTHIYCSIKLLNLKMSQNQQEIDELFKEARNWIAENCGSSRECLHFKALIDILHVTLSFRANRLHDADLSACEINETFVGYEHLKKDKGISLEFAHLCIYYVEKASLRQDQQLQIRYTKEGLKFLKNVFGKKVTKMQCRLYQNLASLYFNHEQISPSMICCPVRGSRSKAQKYLRESQKGWDCLIKRSDTNLKQSKWFSHSMLRNYDKFVSASSSKTKHYVNMESLFEFMFQQIFASPEVDNLEIWELWMRVLCNKGAFERIFEICQNSEKIIHCNKLVYPFNIIMNFLDEFSALKTSPDNFSKMNQRVVVSRLLDEFHQHSDHPKISFWYAFGSKALGELLLDKGDFADFEHFSLKHSHISLQLPLKKYSSYTSLSSAATVSKFLVPISKIAFDLILSIESTLQEQDSVETEVRRSMNCLKVFLQTRFGVPGNQVQIYGPRDYNRIVHRWREARVVMNIQVKGLKSKVIKFFIRSPKNFFVRSKTSLTLIYRIQHYLYSCTHTTYMHTTLLDG